MTDEKKILIGELKDKLSQLFTILNRVRDENTVLKEENSALQSQLDAKEAENKELKRKYENLKTALSLMDSSEVHDTKIKLNRIVRDIEKCMTLLDK